MVGRLTFPEAGPFVVPPNNDPREDLVSTVAWHISEVEGASPLVASNKLDVGIMMQGFAFKSKQPGVNHLAVGIDHVPSLCGSAFFDSASTKAKMLGERMPLDKLVIAHSGLCRKCETIAWNEIEKEEQYYRK
jgi:hypothetical protein